MFLLYINGQYPVYHPIIHLASGRTFFYHASIQHKPMKRRKTKTPPHLLEQFYLWLSVDNAPIDSNTVIVEVSTSTLTRMMESGRLEQWLDVKPPRQRVVFELKDYAEWKDAYFQECVATLRTFGFQFSLKKVMNSLEIGQMMEKLKPEMLMLDASVLYERDSRFIEKMVEIGARTKSMVIMQGIESEEELDYLKRIHCPYGEGTYFNETLDMDEVDVIRTDQEETGVVIGI